MTDARGLAVRAVALTVLGDRVKAEADAVKRQLAESLDPGDRKTAALDSGVKVGTVSFSVGRASARVTDEHQLAEWVKANYSSEVVVSVRPSFLTMLLDNAKKQGSPVDPHTGEIIPGIDVTQGAPYLSIRASDDPAAVAELVDVIRANEVLALEDGAA